MISSGTAMPTLLQRIAANDASAVQETLDRYGRLVFALARRMSAGPSDAEDAVQEIFLEIWKSASRFDPDVAAEPTFITMCARRRLIDRRRRADRRLRPEALPAQLPDSGADHEARIDRSEEAARAAEALKELRPEQKRVLELSIYDGLTHQEIAEETGLPLGTVKTHARRGLLRVRELLTGATGAVGGRGEGS